MFEFDFALLGLVTKSMDSLHEICKNFYFYLRTGIFLDIYI